MKLTEIQGAMLSVLDSDKRLADHFGGKVSPYVNWPQDRLLTLA